MTDVTEPYYPYYVVRRSQELDQIAGAIAKAQSIVKHPTKSRENTHFKNKYAELAGVIDVGKVLNDTGVAIIPTTALTESGLTHTLLLAHESGQWFESDLTIPLSKADAQGVGSALTYARRYHLSMALNVASEDDDDGNTAASQSRRSSEPVAPPPAPVDGPVSAEYVQQVQEAAAKLGASLEDVSAWVTEATRGRTKELTELLKTETPSLRAARDAWVAERPAEAAPTLGLEGGDK